MEIEAVGAVGRVLIKHGDDVRATILLEAHMCDIALGQKFLGAIRHGAFRMLTNRGGPVVIGCSVAHDYGLPLIE